MGTECPVPPDSIYKKKKQTESDGHFWNVFEKKMRKILILPRI